MAFHRHSNDKGAWLTGADGEQYVDGRLAELARYGWGSSTRFRWVGEVPTSITWLIVDRASLIPTILRLPPVFDARTVETVFDHARWSTTWPGGSLG